MPPLIQCPSLVGDCDIDNHQSWRLIINFLFFMAGLVRFVPRGQQNSILIGEPLNSDIDVGKEVRNGHDVKVKVFSGTSVLDAGSETGAVESIDRILSPLSMSEVGAIRCIGLNVRISNKFLKSDQFFFKTFIVRKTCKRGQYCAAFCTSCISVSSNFPAP